MQFCDDRIAVSQNKCWSWLPVPGNTGSTGNTGRNLKQFERFFYSFTPGSRDVSSVSTEMTLVNGRFNQLLLDQERQDRMTGSSLLM